MIAFYNTHLAVGFILHRQGRHLCKNTKKQLAVEYPSHWLETAAVATFPVVEITDCVHSRDNSFQCVPSRIVLNVLSVIMVCQCRYKLHRAVSLRWMNVLSCIPWTSPAVVERSYNIASWHGKLATVSRHFFFSCSFAPLTRNKRKHGWLARLLQARPHLLKEEKGWRHKGCVPPFHTVQFNHDSLENCESGHIFLLMQL